MYRVPFAPLADRTATAIQQQNIAPSPIAASKMNCHNPYAANVLPEDPQAVLQLRRMQSASTLSYDMRCSSLSEPVTPHSPYYPEYASAPVTPLYDFPASPPHTVSFHDDQQSPVTPSSKMSLTKLYVGGRPVAVLTSAVQQLSSALPHMAQHVEPIREREELITSAKITVQFRRMEEEYYIHDLKSILNGATPVRSAVLHKHVIVEGDRGEDLGKIIVIDASYEQNDSDGKHVLPLVKRLATREEVHRYETTLRTEEARALEVVQSHAHRLFPERLVIEDVTFQFDKQKLTIFYRVPDRIYFVPLLKVLNQLYRCRIWMERLDEVGYGDDNDNSAYDQR